MTITEAKFIEPVELPGPRTPGQTANSDRVRADDRTALDDLGPRGLQITRTGVPDATVVPWSNVKFVKGKPAQALAGAETKKRPAKGETQPET